uniref:diphosphoinositol-polyphosphate diphosphatase n=1 Tax=Hucho hucho TaxID=62062 RepID=A0A4W5MBX6_9TELE
MLPKGPDLGQSISKGGAGGPVVEQGALWWSRGPYGGAGLTELLCFLFQVLLVSSSRHPDQWIVPGGGMEPEEEPCGAAVREVFEEAGVKGKLGRLLGVFEQNQDRKHRTYVYVLTVTETLEAWEDSVNIGRKREWFTVDEAIKVLQHHKPDHAEYLKRLHLSCSPTNGNSLLPSQPPNDNFPRYGPPTTGSVLGPSRR